MTKWPQGWRKY